MSVVYALYDALVSINVPDEKAKAVIDALEREMMDKLATRSEMNAEFKLVRQEISALGISLSKDIEAVGTRIDNQTREMTIRFGGMLAATVVLISAVIGIYKAVF
jgi:hypothetical protein